MARHRISQTALGSALGLSQAAVWRRLRGEVPFDVAELEIVARTLSVPLATLVGLEPAPTAYSDTAKAAS